MHISNAGVAQLVERNLAKVEVESSRLFSRSINIPCRFFVFSVLLRFFDGRIAKWLCSGLQSRRRRFDSVSCLHQVFFRNSPKVIRTGNDRCFRLGTVGSFVNGMTWRQVFIRILSQVRGGSLSPVHPENFPETASMKTDV